MLQQQYVIMNVKMLLNKKYLRPSMNRIQSKNHKIGTQKSTRSLCLDLMINYTSTTIDVMDWPLIIRVNYKKTVTLITISKSFFVKQIVSIFSLIRTDSFFVRHIKFEKCNELKEKISEELMPTALHPKKWWDWYVSENEKKQIQLSLKSSKSVMTVYKMGTLKRFVYVCVGSLQFRGIKTFCSTRSFWLENCT